MVRQIAVLVNATDNTQGLRGQISPQRDVVDGSPSPEAQACGDIDRFGPGADWSASRRRIGVELRCPVRWLKSPTPMLLELRKFQI